MYLRWAAPPKADGMDTMKAAVYAACVLEGKEVGEDEVAVSVRCSPPPPARPSSCALACPPGRCPGGAVAMLRRRRLP